MPTVNYNGVSIELDDAIISTISGTESGEIESITVPALPTNYYVVLRHSKRSNSFLIPGADYSVADTTMTFVRPLLHENYVAIFDASDSSLVWLFDPVNGDITP